MSFGMARGIRTAFVDLGWGAVGGEYATADGCACAMGLWYAGGTGLPPAQYRKVDGDLIGGGSRGFFRGISGHTLEGLTVGFDGGIPAEQKRHRQAWHRRYMSGYRAGRRLRKILVEAQS